MVDELVGAPGAQVHVRCVGHGAVTVVLIAGFEGDVSAWNEVESALASRSRVCSYDRPGTGASAPAIATATFATQAADLHALLEAIGEPGPYVVVGHSFGGAAAVTFASRFPGEVVGLALVDATPPTWPDALCAVEDASTGAAMLRALCIDAFPASGNDEHLDVHAAFAEVAQITSLGSLPMAVLTATARELPADLAPAERARLNEVWDLGQHAWASLSSASHVVPVADTGHAIASDQPELVVAAVAALLP